MRVNNGLKLFNFETPYYYVYMGCEWYVCVMLLDPYFSFLWTAPLLCHPHYLIIALTTLCLPFS